MRDGGPTYGRPTPEERLFRVARQSQVGMAGGLSRSTAPVQRPLAQMPVRRGQSGIGVGDYIWCWRDTMSAVVTDTFTTVKFFEHARVGESLTLAGDGLSVVINQPGVYAASAFGGFVPGATGNYMSNLVIYDDVETWFVRASGNLDEDVSSGSYPATVALALTLPASGPSLNSAVAVDVRQDSGSGLDVATAYLYVVRVA